MTPTISMTEFGQTFFVSGDVDIGTTIPSGPDPTSVSDINVSDSRWQDIDYDSWVRDVAGGRKRSAEDVEAEIADRLTDEAIAMLEKGELY